MTNKGIAPGELPPGVRVLRYEYPDTERRIYVFAESGPKIRGVVAFEPLAGDSEWGWCVLYIYRPTMKDAVELGERVAAAMRAGSTKEFVELANREHEEARRRAQEEGTR